MFYMVAASGCMVAARAAMQSAFSHAVSQVTKGSFVIVACIVATKVKMKIIALHQQQSAAPGA
jgi:hypothetical protein